MRFTISMEGRQGQVLHDATLNGLPYHAGEKCGVGWKKFVVQAQDAESFETNHFVWYGGAMFGNITLARSHGRMDLGFSPPVETVRIIGAEERKSFGKVAHESLSLPTGHYAVEAKFARFSIERTVDISRNQTTSVIFAPALTTLNLSSDPGPAGFQLNSTKGLDVSVSGSTPASITELPVGEYELAMVRGDYRKELPVTLSRTKPTNELKVEFRYAKLSITSDPPDAAIGDVDLVVGLHRFREQREERVDVAPSDFPVGNDPGEHGVVEEGPAEDVHGGREVERVRALDADRHRGGSGLRDGHRSFLDSGTPSACRSDAETTSGERLTARLIRVRRVRGVACHIRRCTDTA
jgi:hypothetical protein